MLSNEPLPELICNRCSGKRSERIYFQYVSLCDECILESAQKIEKLNPGWWISNQEQTMKNEIITKTAEVFCEGNCAHSDNIKIGQAADINWKSYHIKELYIKFRYYGKMFSTYPATLGSQRIPLLINGEKIWLSGIRKQIIFLHNDKNQTDIVKGKITLNNLDFEME